MTQPAPSLTQHPAWQALTAHQSRMRQCHMRDLFAGDPQRFQRYCASGAGLTLDYSKNLITADTLALLLQLARECDLPERIEAMFGGQRLNNTENRPALHTALRVPAPARIDVNGSNIVPEVQATLARMEAFVDQVHSGQWRGFTGKPLRDVVSIGIGGSYLGPRMVAEALRPYWREGLNCHYVANIDGSDITEVLRQVSPDTTLFLVQSKSFGTQETLANSRVARDWFLGGGGSEEAVARHFVAVTANTPAAREFGIAGDSIFPMWDWVGGRYSLWSAIGLPVALTIGMASFRDLLAGAHDMDMHFRNTPLTHNLPTIMALLGVWYTNFWGANTHTILPYDHYLKELPAHLQQLDMESNGKCVTRDGTPVTYATGPVIWGGVGANGQHAYHQLLHQGTVLSPADFIIPLRSHNPVAHHHATLFANCLGQSQALMRGKTAAEVRAELTATGMEQAEIDRLTPHRVIPGNKPSNTLVLEQTTPTSVGALVALYEHRTFVQGVVWDVNPFDQWGVELGKQLGQDVLRHLDSDSDDQAGIDSSTAGLIELFRQNENG